MEVGNRLRRTLSITLTLILLLQGLTTSAFAVGNSSASEISTALQANNMVVNVKDVDVRDVLSAIALNMGYSVVYTGPAQNISLRLENVPPKSALDYVLRMLDLTYIQEGSTLIIGDRNTLQNNFNSTLSLTKFQLRYITPTVITEKIGQLNIPVTVLRFDSNDTEIWVQGLPADIAKVRELINIIDVEQNKEGLSSNYIPPPADYPDYSDMPDMPDFPTGTYPDPDSDSSLADFPTFSDFDESDEFGAPPIKTISYIKLRNVSAYEFNAFLQTLGIYYGLAIADDDDRLYIYATPDERQEILRIRSKVDAKSAYVDLSLGDTYAVINTGKVNKQYAASAIQSVSPGLTVVWVDNVSATLLVRGRPEDIDRAKTMVSQMIRAAGDVEKTFHEYEFKNIPADEVKGRLEGLNVNDNVSFYYPSVEFSNKIFVYCTEEYWPEIEKVLKKIDETESSLFAKYMPVYTSNFASAERVRQLLEYTLGDLVKDKLEVTPYTGNSYMIMLKDPTAELTNIVTAMIERLRSTDSATIDPNRLTFDYWWDTIWLPNNPGSVKPNPVTDFYWAEYGKWVNTQSINAINSSGATGYSTEAYEGGDPGDAEYFYPATPGITPW